MSIIKKLLSRFKVKKVHNGKPYSFEELMGMGDDELGSLYKKCGELYYKTKSLDDDKGFIITSSMEVISVAAIIGGGFIVNNIISDLGTKVACFLFLIFSGPFLGLLIGISLSALYEHIINIKNGANAFNDVKRPNIALDNISTLLKESTKDKNHNILAFLNKAEKAIWMDGHNSSQECSVFCPVFNYPDKDLGRLVKILLPIMKLEHDGGSLNDESFKVLDDKLHLSSEINAFNKKIPDIRNKIEEEKIRSEKEKKAKEEYEEKEKEKKNIKNSISIASSLVNNLPDDDHNMDKILEEHPEFRRIKDLNKKLSKQKTRLDVSLAAHQE